MSLSSSLVDEAVPSVMGVVAVHEGETSHWERDVDTGDVHVSVVTHGHGSPMKALLHGGGGGGVGFWAIPPVGTEVAVVFPDGDYEGDPVLYGGGGAPEGLDGTTILIIAPAGGRVVIDDGSGGTGALVTKEEFEAHDHAAPTLTGGSTTYAAGVGARTSAPDPITGTKVLEAR